MARPKKEEAEPKFDINELAKKLQIATNAIAKDLKVKPMGFDAPKGTNGSLSTGSLTADLVTGGGFPKHRMTTVSGDSGAGKTTLVQKALGKTLDRGLICHYVDVEGAADYAWMLRGGTDMNKFLGKRGEPKKLWYIPDFQTGEDAFRYIERNLVEMDKLGAAQAPGLVSAFFLDSLAAMIPAEELENDERGDSPTQAKMFSRWIRLIRAGWLKRANSSFIAINQIRENPRQKFGCLHGDTKIRLVDGRVLPIRDIVTNKIQGEVWSYDAESKALKAKRITNWFNNGLSAPEDWVLLKTEGPGSKRGSHEITVTKNHKFLTPSGEWSPAGGFAVGDEVLSRYESRTNGKFREFLLGVMVGDSGIHETYNRGAIVFQNQEQPEYHQWKLGKLSAVLEFKAYANSLVVSRPRVDMEELRKQIPKRNPLGILDQLTPLSLAVWFMDDGHHREDRGLGSLCCKRLEADEVQIVRTWLNKMGYENTDQKTHGMIAFSQIGFDRLCKTIAPYVPPCMEYKLLPGYRGRYVDFNLDHEIRELVLSVKILEIRPISAKKARALAKFDLEIEGTHNYVACSKHGGLVVHNSPEYEPGGAAPTFYADVKLWLRRTGKAKTLDYKKDHALTPKDTTLFRAQGISIEKNPNGTEDRYFYTNIKAVKNRVFPPFKETYMRIWTEENGGAGRGIDPVWDTLRFFEEIGMAEFPDSFEVKLKGKVYSYYDLKAEILAKPDLQQEAWSLLQSGNAFDLYFARLAGGEVEVGKPDDETPDEAEEAGEAGVPA